MTIPAQVQRIKLTVKVDRGVPVPPRAGLYQPSGMSLAFRDILLEMGRGDSFIVDTNSKRQLCLMVARREGMRLVTRKVNGAGYRIWLMSQRRAK